MKFLLDGEQSERLYFRLVQQSDYNTWLPFFQDPNNFKHWIEPNESAEQACTKWFERQLHRYEFDRGEMNALVEKQSGELIGYCGLLVQTVDELEELEIGYSLLPQYWNKGFASEAAIKCLDYAFDRQFSPSLISIISVTNVPSARVAVKNGMTLSKTTIYKENRVNIFPNYPPGVDSAR